jgi:glycosyltransferase involved in cell wall biosynthesis
LLSDEAHARLPVIRQRLLSFFEHNLTQEQHRSATLRRLGLPISMLDLTPEVPLSVPTCSITRSQYRTELSLAVIATKNYLPFASVTINSFIAFHPDIPVFLLLVDGSQADKQLVTNCTIVVLEDLSLPNIGWYAAKYSASQLSNALKPVFLAHLKGLTHRIIYFDSDIAVFGSCAALINAASEHDLVLIPHMLAPFPRPEQLWVHPNTADIYNAGLFNGGMFAMNLDSCSDFLTFWRTSNFAIGAFYGPAGGQTDQQYLNWAILLQQNLYVLRDPAYNVAYWNLHDRSVRGGKATEKQFTVNGAPLVTFHFSGFDVYDSLKLSKHDNRYSVYNLHSVACILLWYRDQVLAGPHADLLAEPYKYDRLANGFRVTEFLRGIFQKYENYFPKYDIRKTADADKLCRFLMTPLAATGSLLPLVAAVIYDQRPDLQQLFPRADIGITTSEYWRWFCVHAGREYGIEFLISEHRSVLVSDSLVGFSEQLELIFRRSARWFRFLGIDRAEASASLRANNQTDIANSLLGGDNEWHFFSPISAVLNVYMRRADLQEAFPKLFGDNHASFSHWLHENATREHGMPREAIDQFDSNTADKTLTRLFNFFSRRSDLQELIHRELLTDNNSDLLRTLLREAAEAMEYGVADVEIFRFLHVRERELLVPLYLELPGVRRAARSARIPDQKMCFLPGEVQGRAWASAGCRLHERYFELLESLIEDEVKRVYGPSVAAPANIFDVIRNIDVRKSAVHAFTTAAAEARRRYQQFESRSRTASLASQRESCDANAKVANLPSVNLFGFFYADTGVGESARGLARAIAHVRDVRRLALTTGSIQESTSLDALFHRYDYKSDTNVIVSYPHQHEDHFGTLPREYFWGRKNIIHLAWEQRDWNPHWKAVYDRYDEIWSISQFSALPFQEMFGSRVRAVDMSKAIVHRRKLRFLYVFDANSSIERKNPEGCLDAFISAFSHTSDADSVQLYLKVGNLGRPEHAVRIERLRRKAMLSGLDIFFDGRILSRDALLRLISSADCYVSLHRAEGFGYTMAEAMYFGVPVIASGYSGNLEYMSSDDSYLVPCTESYVNEADGPFQRGSLWGEPNIDAAVAYMRQIVTDRDGASQIGQKGHLAVKSKLSAAIIANAVRPSLT